MAGTYKEILARFKKDLGNTYQAQKNIVDVSQKYIGLLENAEGGSGAGGIDYSTDEQDTGLKWIDGKKVYRKTISVGAMPNATIKNVDHNITNLDTVISASGMVYRTDDQSYYTLPLVHSFAASNNISISVTGTQISLATGYNWSTITDNGYVTILYTKSA